VGKGEGKARERCAPRRLVAWCIQSMATRARGRKPVASCVGVTSSAFFSNRAFLLALPSSFSPQLAKRRHMGNEDEFGVQEDSGYDLLDMQQVCHFFSLGKERKKRKKRKKIGRKDEQWSTT
jgi:hypothetical protein